MEAFAPVNGGRFGMMEGCCYLSVKTYKVCGGPAKMLLQDGRFFCKSHGPPECCRIAKGTSTQGSGLTRPNLGYKTGDPTKTRSHDPTEFLGSEYVMEFGPVTNGKLGVIDPKLFCDYIGP